RGPLLQERFGASARTLQGTALEGVRVRASLWTLLDFLPNLTMAVVVLLGVLAVAHGSMSLGALVAFTSLLVLLQWPVIDFGWILSVAQEAATAAQRIYEVFDEAPLVADHPGASALRDVTGRIAFEAVSFRYPGSG